MNPRINLPEFDFSPLAEMASRIQRNLAPILNASRRLGEEQERMLAPLNAQMKQLHSNLEPTLNAVRRANEKQRRIFEPLNNSLDFSPLARDIPFRPTQEKPQEGTAIYDHDLITENHPLRLENERLQTECQSLETKLSAFYQEQTHQRKLGGYRRHSLTNSIKVSIIYPILAGRIMEEKNPHATAIKIYNLLSNAKPDKSSDAIHADVFELSEKLSLDSGLLPKTVEHFSSPHDTLKTLYKWCREFYKDS